MKKSIQSQQIERRFSAAAGTYEAQSRIHEQVAEALLQECPARQPASILEIGAGTGLLTRRLTQHFPYLPITALDISPSMLKENAKRMPEGRPVEYVQSDFLDPSLTGQYDLICSNAVLHWLPPLPSLLEKVDHHLLPGGTFSAAVMTANTFWRLREAQAHALGQSALTPLLPDTLDWQEALLLSPFELLQLRVDRLRETFLNTQAFLRYLNETGVTGSRPNRKPLTRKQLRDLMSYYDEHFATAEGIEVEYEVLYFHCRKSG